MSFLVALSYMLLELLVFRTMSIKGAASPMVIAGALPISSAQLANTETKKYIKDGVCLF